MYKEQIEKSIEERMLSKGCVYFFRHIGFDVIKIGYSLNSSPIGRFKEFKVYAPYGAELVGFIRSYNPLELEQSLHDKYKHKRLQGEWFDMTRETALNEIKYNSDLEDIKKMNEFQVEWAEKIEFDIRAVDPDFYKIIILNTDKAREAIMNQNSYSVTLKFFEDIIRGNGVVTVNRKVLREVIVDLFGEPNKYRWSTKRLREVIGSDY